MIFDQIIQPRNLKWVDIKEGDSASFDACVTQKEVDTFMALCGNSSPLHTNESFAKKKGFERSPVYGMFLASFFSTLVGMYLPGRNCLCMAQSCQFKKAIFVDDKIKVRGQVIKKIDATKMLYIKTTIENQEHIVCINGEALVKYI